MSQCAQRSQSRINPELQGLYKRPPAQVLNSKPPESRFLQLLNMSSQYFIPDLLITWPWQRIINPALADVKDDSNAWVKSLALFEESQLRKFNACDFSTRFIHWMSISCILADRYFSDLLAALVAPQQDKGWFMSA
jgi:hypothetical protein